MHTSRIFYNELYLILGEQPCHRIKYGALNFTNIPALTVTCYFQHQQSSCTMLCGLNLMGIHGGQLLFVTTQHRTSTGKGGKTPQAHVQFFDNPPTRAWIKMK